MCYTLTIKFYTIYKGNASMKKRILFTTILGILGALIVLGGHYFNKILIRQARTPVSMIIASDIHYLSPEYRGEHFKEPSAIFDGKLTHYSPEYFDAFLAEVIEKHPQVLILSGDITLNGSVKSHEEVIEKLKNVQAAGIDVLVIPGNHDVHSTAGDYTPAEPVIVDSVFAAGFMELYENFGPAQAISRDENTFSYIYEASPNLRILMIDSNCLGKGTVQDETLAWMETQLKDAKSAGADIIAVSHQNLHIHSELLYFSYQMYNADELLALYEKYDVKLSLSGHIHVQSIVSEETTPGTTIPEVAVGALSVCGTPYGELSYNGKELTYQTVKTDVSAYALDQGWTDENLLNFNNYSYWYFEEVGRLQTFDGYKDSDLSTEEITLLADTFAKINSAYFTGEDIDTDVLSEGISLWNTQQDGFFYKYIQSMLAEDDVNNQTITINLY